MQEGLGINNINYPILPADRESRIRPRESGGQPCEVAGGRGRTRGRGPCEAADERGRTRGRGPGARGWSGATRRASLRKTGFAVDSRRVARRVCGVRFWEVAEGAEDLEGITGWEPGDSSQAAQPRARALRRWRKLGRLRVAQESFWGTKPISRKWVWVLQVAPARA